MPQPLLLSGQPLVKSEMRQLFTPDGQKMFLQYHCTWVNLTRLRSALWHTDTKTLAIKCPLTCSSWSFQLYCTVNKIPPVSCLSEPTFCLRTVQKKKKKAQLLPTALMMAPVPFKCPGDPFVTASQHAQQQEPAAEQPNGTQPLVNFMIYTCFSWGDMSQSPVKIAHQCMATQQTQPTEGAVHVPEQNPVGSSGNNFFQADQWDTRSRHPKKPGTVN